MLWPSAGTVEIHRRGNVYVVRYISQRQCRAYRTRRQRSAHYFAALSGQKVIVCYVEL